MTVVLTKFTKSSMTIREAEAYAFRWAILTMAVVYHSSPI